MGEGCFVCGGGGQRALRRRRTRSVRTPLSSAEAKKKNPTQPKLKTKPPPPEHNRHDHHHNNNSTVADGTCSFPSNMFGCESAAKGITGGGVKFLAEDRALECEGKDAGKCASRATFTAN